MKVRSKSYVIFSYGINTKAYIHIYPQQKWEYQCFEDDLDKIVLSRKGTSIEIRRADFEKCFIECI